MAGIGVVHGVALVHLGLRRGRILAPDPRLAARAIPQVAIADVVGDRPHGPALVLVPDTNLRVVDALRAPLLKWGVPQEVVELPVGGVNWSAICSARPISGLTTAI